MRAVSDTGPLISLEKLTDGFLFMRQRYDVLVVPPAVLDELSFRYDSHEAYLQHYGLLDLVVVQTPPADVVLPQHAEDLHRGETEAIRLALALQWPLLIEEKQGRHVARAVGLNISGIAGEIIRAHRDGDLEQTQTRAMLNELLVHNRINARIHQRVIASLES